MHYSTKLNSFTALIFPLSLNLSLWILSPRSSLSFLSLPPPFHIDLNPIGQGQQCEFHFDLAVEEFNSFLAIKLVG